MTEHLAIARTAILVLDPQLQLLFAPRQRRAVLNTSFTGKPTLFDLVQSNGIPHTEVGGVKLKEQLLDWQHHLQGDECLQLIANQVLPTWRPLRFILDVHLGRLARRLRLLGFDCVYKNDLADPEIVARARQERRIILTRDKGILFQRKVTYGHFLRSTYFQSQVEEVFRRYQLIEQCQPFSRCSLCNGELCGVDAEDFVAQLPAAVFEYQNQVSRCRDCQKFYWTGTHYQKLLRWIARLRVASQR